MHYAYSPEAGCARPPTPSLAAFDTHKTRRHGWSRHPPRDMVYAFRYDALGRRIEKGGPDIRICYDWDGDVLLHERVQAGEHAPRRIDWDFEENSFAPLWRREETLEALCVCEPNGAPREWVSPEGYLLWRARYDGLGKVEGLEAAPGFECAIRLQGQWADEESGLHYNRFRYYDPGVGRFISPDPIGLLGGFNLYAFAPNVTGWVDPWGSRDAHS